MAGRGEAVGDHPVELFRELLRQLPTVRAEDYLKDGKWLKDLIITDTEIIIAHRRECGSPEPPPLDDVELPELPPGARHNHQIAPWEVAPARSVSAPPASAPPASASTGSSSAAQVARSTSAPHAPSSNGSTSAAHTELRAVASFVQKWKLDLVRTKLLLSRLAPARRTAVIENFKTTANGVSPMVALEFYIKKTESPAGAGTGATSVRPAAQAKPTPTASVPTGSVKRPTSSGAPQDADAKRPRSVIGSSSSSVQRGFPSIRPTSVPAQAAASSWASKPPGSKGSVGWTSRTPAAPGLMPASSKPSPGSKAPASKPPALKPKQPASKPPAKETASFSKPGSLIASLLD